MDSSFRVRSTPPPQPPKDEHRELMERLEKLRRPIPPEGDEVDAFEDPTDTVNEKTERLKHDLCDPEIKFDDLPNVPKTPIIDTFARPTTKMLGAQTIDTTPKAPEVEEKNLSEQLQKCFPDIDQKVNEKEKDYKIDIENLSEVLSEIGKNEIVPFEFEFFHGGKNEKFNEIIRSLAPSTNNLEFLEFLQSDVCSKILVNNKLKIHIETGIIYYDNHDTNESITSFILAQQNPISGFIEHQFVFDRDYKSYFDWLVNGLTNYEKQKLDLFKNRNSKFLFYHFNDYLQ